MTFYDPIHICREIETERERKKEREGVLSLLKPMIKTTIALHQCFFMVIRVFQPNLTPTYSIRLLTKFYPRQGLNLFTLQRLDL